MGYVKYIEESKQKVYNQSVANRIWKKVYNFTFSYQEAYRRIAYFYTEFG